MARLTTDNVLVALSRSHSPSVLSGVRLVAIDALISGGPWVCGAGSAEVRQAGTLEAPMCVSSREKFIATYGDCEDVDSADFDL